VRYDRINALSNLGRLDADLNNGDQALRSLSDALEIAVALHKIEPDNQKWTAALIRAELDLANFDIAQVKSAEGEALLLRARRMLDGNMPIAQRYRDELTWAADAVAAKLALAKGDTNEVVRIAARRIPDDAGQLASLLTIPRNGATILEINVLRLMALQKMDASASVREQAATLLAETTAQSPGPRFEWDELRAWLTVASGNKTEADNIMRQYCAVGFKTTLYYSCPDDRRSRTNH
jgi:hypothetical protein